MKEGVLLRMKKKFSYLLLSFILIFNAFNGSIVRADTTTTNTTSALEQGREIIKDYYLETVPDSVLNAPTLTDIVNGLNDPYSHYFTAEEYTNFVNSINNSFCGIGITMDIVPDGAKVLSVIDASPAEAAGVQVGDIITEADGHLLAGLTNDEIVSYIRGTEGTTIDLKLERGQTSLEFKIVRQQINLPTVAGKILNNNIGYIDLASFGDTTASEFSSVLNTMPNVNSYIVDLRNNGGGYISTAQDIAGYFIGNNPLVKLTDKTGTTEVISALNHNVISNKPIIFLVNENTASASEILSAAVKDYDNAYFIGTKTYGKGVAQCMYPLTDGSVLKLTTYKFVSPKGNEINKVGITPDLVLDDKAANAIDPLQMAEVLLSGSPSSSDETGVTKLDLGSKSFEISPQILQDSAYTQTVNYLMNNVVSADNEYIWNNGQWTQAAPDGIEISYAAYVQNTGWEATVNNGLEAGTDGRSLRMEALKLNLTGNLPAGASIKYKAHVENIGWQNWVTDSIEAGTDGKSKRLEAVQIQLVGLPGYTVQYRAYEQDTGWQNWVTNGATAGTTGQSRRLEALEVRIVKN
jgi:carboxyl-terminal processing protease